MGKDNSTPKIPKLPDSSKLYGQGVNDYFKYLPQFLQGEQGARDLYDPQRIAQQQKLQSDFGPTQYAQMSQAFQALDPAYFAAHNQLGNQVMSDAALGTQLSPSQVQQQQQFLRGSQVARGNASGASAGIAEAYSLGDKGQQMYQQRLGNLGGFLQSPSLAQQANFVPPVSADRSSAYVNPAAGYQGQQFGLSNFQNALGSAGLQQGGGGNPWMSAIGGVGSILGGIIGSGAFSDRRLKTDIKKVGKDDQGLNLYKFSYRGPKFIGHMADEVKEKFPDDVAKDPVSGYYMVSQRFAPVQQEA